MPAGGFLPDEYTWRARLAPALLAMLPGAFTVLAWAPGPSVTWDALYSLFTAAGGTLFLQQFVRRLGLKKEPALFARWGGRPSERMLTRSGAPNPHVLRARHAKLQALLPNVRIPTADEEARDFSSAILAYNACVIHLAGVTRGDRTRYRLLFEENCNYGFSRNLWATKAIGIVVAVVGSVLLGGDLAIKL